MAKVDVVMPQMGESITTGTITKWHKAPGDEIEIDEILLEISTDKVESEIPSPVKGRVWDLLFKEGDTVDVGVKIAEIEDDLSVAFDGASSSSSAPAPSAPAETPAPAKAPAAAPAAATPAPANGNGNCGAGRKFYTPLVKALAREHGVDLSELDNIPGTGAGGRVNRADFENFLKTRSTPTAGGGVATSPEPVQAKAPSAPSAPPAAAPVSGGTPSGKVEVIPMDNMRKAIAKNMVESKLTSPHVNSMSEVDMTHLVRFRESVKNDFQNEEGFKLTYTPFIMWAIIQALREYPRVNASVDGDNIVVKKDINLGCAVAVPGNGLIVPVIKNADNLNMLGLCRAINTLAHKARDGKLTMDEITGGTFTFTNVGSFGTLMATPVILQPQVGIFAAGVIQKRPVVVGDAIAIRSMMYATHTYDHRIIDGELGGKFLEAVMRNLREMSPEALF